MGTVQQRWWRNAPVLGLIWLGGAMGDRLWLALDQSVPAWDAADYLNGVMNYWHFFVQGGSAAVGQPDFWQLSSKVPPLLYVATVPVFALLQPGVPQALLLNLALSALLLGTVYGLAGLWFTPRTGLWAAGLCVLLPGLARVRLEFLLDFPLTVLVTLAFACLSGLWWVRPMRSRPVWQPWGLAGLAGVTVGLALLTKQTALFFLLVPLFWLLGTAVWQRRWAWVGQWVGLVAIATGVIWPWYRTNWLLMLTAGKRATVDSALAEGDPGLWSLQGWTYYLRLLPAMVTVPLLLAGLVGLLCFWRRSRVSSQQCSGDWDYAPKSRQYRAQSFAQMRQVMLWLLGFLVGGYVLSSLNPNKDPRYVLPLLPMVALLLGYGLCLMPRAWRSVRWAAVGLALLLTVNNLFWVPGLSAAVRPNSVYQHRVQPGPPPPVPELTEAIVAADPYLQSTVGVLPSTPQINQHNVTFFGNVRQWRVYGRQVGTLADATAQDGRSLPWFLLKTGAQGSIRRATAQTALSDWVRQSAAMTLHQAWDLPDATQLQLYRRQQPLIQVTPLAPATDFADAPVRLEQVQVPDRAPAGQPVPVTYQWSGSQTALEQGLVLLTWHPLDQDATATQNRWLHDHAIANGFLRFGTAPADTPFQVTETLAMLPPATLAPGTYTLSATYFQRQTGATTSLPVPRVRLILRPDAPPTPAPEVDWVTQLRNLAATLPQGLPVLDRLFREIGRISQYDPTQDYVTQLWQAMDYRRQQDPTNLEFAYASGLAHALKRQIDPAIAAWETITELQPEQAVGHAYLAVLYLYDWQARAAQDALETAIALQPKLPELYALQAVAALMRGQLGQAWQAGQTYQTLSAAAKQEQSLRLSAGDRAAQDG